MQGITDPAEPFFKDGQWAWDGTLWRKLPITWGYSAPFVVDATDTGVTAASHSLYSGGVDTGEVWVIHTMWAVNYMTVITHISLSIVRDEVEYPISQTLTPVVGVGKEWSGTIVLAEGDQVTAYFKDCALNDDIRFSCSGYKMKVTE